MVAAQESIWQQIFSINTEGFDSYTIVFIILMITLKGL